MLNVLRRNSAKRQAGPRRCTRALVAQARAAGISSWTLASPTPSTAASTWWPCMPGWCSDACGGRAWTTVAQALSDAIFVGFDEALRELGAGDMGMGRRMKEMADAFYGRLQAYERGDAAKRRWREAIAAQRLSRRGEPRRSSAARWRAMR